MGFIQSMPPGMQPINHFHLAELLSSPFQTTPTLYDLLPFALIYTTQGTHKLFGTRVCHFLVLAIVCTLPSITTWNIILQRFVYLVLQHLCYMDCYSGSTFRHLILVRFKLISLFVHSWPSMFRCLISVSFQALFAFFLFDMFVFFASIFSFSRDCTRSQISSL